MPTKSTRQTFDLAAALMSAFSTNGRINEYLIENLPEEAWRSQTPGGKGRTKVDPIVKTNSRPQ